MDSSAIYKQVEAHYGSLARTGAPADSSAIAKAFGYSEEDLSNIPSDSNLGVSCGNPLALATLREASLRLHVPATSELSRRVRARRSSISVAVLGLMCSSLRSGSGSRAVLLGLM
jgi:hypothetical protein